MNGSFSKWMMSLFLLLRVCLISLCHRGDPGCYEERGTGGGREGDAGGKGAEGAPRHILCPAGSVYNRLPQIHSVCMILFNRFGGMAD